MGTNGSRGGWLLVGSWLVAASAAAQWTDLVRLNVTSGLAHGARAVPYDIDRDGDRDLVMSYTFADAVYLALNLDGVGATWQNVLVAPNLVAPNARPFDADCDGDRDIAGIGFIDRDLGFESLGKVTWYERPADLTTSPWAESVIEDSLIHVFTLDVGDIDGDSDEDLMVSTISWTVENRISWIENRCGQLGPRWQRWDVAVDAAVGDSRPVSARLADIDGDGTLDVIAADAVTSRLLWYANEGNPRRTGWTGRAIVADSGAYNLPDAIRPYDMDGDGDQDVVATFAGSNSVDWFERPSDPTLQPWVAHAIAAGFPAAHDIVVGDFDNDRRVDVAATSPEPGRGGSDTVAVFQNNGDGTFVRRMPDGDYFSANYLEAGDIDGDGDLDLTSGSYGGDSIDWWRNDHPVTTTQNPREASPSGDMRVTKGLGGVLQVTYTPAACSTDHAIYWDRGPIPSGADWSGVVCRRGATGTTNFDPGTVPPGAFVYFVIVGQNETQEGSYGRASSLVERSDATSFGACDRTAIVSGSCP